MEGRMLKVFEFWPQPQR